MMDKDNFPRYQKIIATICLAYTFLGVLLVVVYNIILTQGPYLKEKPTLLAELAIFLAAALLIAVLIFWRIRRTRAKGFDAYRAEELSTLFDKAPVGMAKVLPSGLFLKVNKQFCDFLGYTEEELLGMTFMDVTLPDDLPKSNSNLKRFAAGEFKTLSSEKCYLRKDRAIVWAQLDANSISDETGHLQYMIAVIIDITKRKNVEKAFEENNRYYQAVLDNTFDGIALVDKDGIITYQTPAVEKIIGYSFAERKGKNAFSHLPEEFRIQAQANFNALVESPNLHQYIIAPYVHKDGKIRMLEISTKNLLLDPTINAIVTNFRDITEQHAIQETIKKSEHNYRMLVDNLPAGAFRIDGENISFNKETEKITGYSNDEIHTLDQWFEAMYREKKNAVRAIYDKHKEGGFEGTRTVPITRKDGVERWVAFSAYNYGTSIVWLMNDITDQKMAQDKIVSSIIEGEDRERQRIASELHDSLGQQLTASALNFQSILEHISQLELDKQQQFNLGLSFLNKAIEESRNIAHNLMPMSIKDFGLILGWRHCLRPSGKLQVSILSSFRTPARSASGSK